MKKTVATVPAPKPTPVPCVIQVPNAAAAYGLSISGCTIKVVPPVPVTTTVSKPKPVTTVVVTSQTDQAAFTPNPIGISASATSGMVGQAFFFSAIATAHSRSAVVLGRTAEVNFTPISFDWGGGTGSSYSSSWATAGNHSVSLTVGYAVSYSVGGGWTDAGIINSAASVEISIADVPPAPATKPVSPRLVSGNCISKPSSYRC